MPAFVDSNVIAIKILNHKRPLSGSIVRVGRLYDRCSESLSALPGLLEVINHKP